MSEADQVLSDVDRVSRAIAVLSRGESLGPISGAEFASLVDSLKRVCESKDLAVLALVGSAAGWVLSQHMQAHIAATVAVDRVSRGGDDY